MKRRINLLREFSVPLLAGVVLALAWANLDPAGYDGFLHRPFLGPFTFHFLTNDIFMVFFFGIAAVEITQSCLPGGDLNPPRKAVNPLLATLGGVAGPALVYLGLNHLIGSAELARGWGIPTATDIAFAWLVARLVFGSEHPAISFLLLLAVADDGIGLAIIALFYPDPHSPVEPRWLLLLLGGMLLAYVLRRCHVRNYWPYLLAPGIMSWFGLHRAHLHPALALVFIVPFLVPARREKMHLFEDDPGDRSPLARFEHEWKVVVDFGMFMFGLANAGVRFSSAGTITWLVFMALLLGKCGGIFLLGSVAERFGFPLPHGMRKKELFVAGIIGGFGFTVALFVSGEAFVDPVIQGAAKMGAMMSAAVAVVALGAGRVLGVGRAS
ncbi:Na+/H+ antiporter NhaA [Geobacter sp.]|uniref:Na+/H+ antiporter NhaA n=1 Tax=Geobacter sp. TaxID=46610 RepID=UPI002618D101|nr:Na+/H+ antiporter NhaA [Geobacter sp.]